MLKAEGYAGLTIAKVAARAGESKPLVAYHFGSKQGLVQASGRAVAEVITAEALASVEGATTVEEVIRGAAEGIERLLDRDERLARLYFDLAAVSVVDPEIRQHDHGGQRRLAGGADRPVRQRRVIAARVAP